MPRPVSGACRMGTVTLANRLAAIEPAIRRMLAIFPRTALTVASAVGFAVFCSCGRKYQTAPATSRKRIKKTEPLLRVWGARPGTKRGAPGEGSGEGAAAIESP